MLMVYYIAELLYLQHHTVATIVGDTHMNDHLVTQSMRYNSRLVNLYKQWDMSQNIFEVLLEHKDIHMSTKQKLKPALENTLMKEVLDLYSPSPSELFQGISLASLQHGFSCVDLEIENHELVLILDIIRGYTSSYSKMDIAAYHPPASIHSDHFSFGTFKLYRNAPVNRLWNVALQTMTEDEALTHILMAGLQYNAIYSETRHIGPPQCVYDDFYNWGIRNEGFASPFNARLLGKKDAHFFSAFPHTDSVFGSNGSFFMSDWKEHSGAWCVDPPFLTKTLTRVDHIVSRWRKEGSPPILYIGPSSYKMQTPFDEEIRLYKDIHYYEGLDGLLHVLPVDVSIWRFGDIVGFDTEKVIAGYLPQK